MTALTKSRNSIEQMDTISTVPVRYFELPMGPNAHHYAGALVCTDSSGYTTTPGNTLDLMPVGISVGEWDNRNGPPGAIKAKIQAGTFLMRNSGGADNFTIADRGKIAYIVDDQQVAKTSNSGTRSPCGKMFDMDASGENVFVTIGVPSLYDQPDTTDSRGADLYQGPQPTGASIIIVDTDQWTTVRDPALPSFDFRGGRSVFFTHIQIENTKATTETWQADLRLVIDGDIVISIGSIVDTQVGVHKFYSFTTITSLISAGPHSVALQMQRHQGTGSLVVLQNFDWSSLSLIEFS